MPFFTVQCWISESDGAYEDEADMDESDPEYLEIPLVIADSGKVIYRIKDSKKYIKQLSQETDEAEEKKNPKARAPAKKDKGKGRAKAKATGKATEVEVNGMADEVSVAIHLIHVLTDHLWTGYSSCTRGYTHGWGDGRVHGR